MPSGGQLDTVVHLRRLLNQHADGYITAFDDSVRTESELPAPERIHRMMKTGVVGAKDFEALIDALGLGPDVLAQWPIHLSMETDVGPKQTQRRSLARVSDLVHTEGREAFGALVEVSLSTVQGSELTEGALQDDLEIAGFELPARIEWCTGPLCDLVPLKLRVCRDSITCDANEKLRLRWTLNGQAFSPFFLVRSQEKPAPSMTRLDGAVRVREDGALLEGSSVDIEKERGPLSLFPYRREMWSTHGTYTMAYKTSSLRTPEGVSHVVYWEGEKDELFFDHATMHRRFAELAQASAKAVGIPYKSFAVWVMPLEIYAAFSRNGWSPGRYADGQVGLSYSGLLDDVHQGELTQDQAAETLGAYFVHEYAHQLLEPAALVCFEEGLADALSIFQVPHAIRPDKSTRMEDYSIGCQALRGTHGKGECILWHLERELGLTAEVLAALFREAAPLEFDDCALGTDATGLRYFQYLSQATGHNAAAVMEGANIPLPISYEAAKALSLDEIGAFVDPYAPPDWWSPEFDLVPKRPAEFYVDLNRPAKQIRAFRLNRSGVYEVSSSKGLFSVTPTAWFGTYAGLGSQVTLSLSVAQAQTLGLGVHKDSLTVRAATGIELVRDVHITIVADAAAETNKRLQPLPEGIERIPFDPDFLNLGCGDACVADNWIVPVCASPLFCLPDKDYRFELCLNGQPNSDAFVLLFHTDLVDPRSEAFDLRATTEGFVHVKSDSSFINLGWYPPSEVSFEPGDHILDYQGTRLTSSYGSSDLVRLVGTGGAWLQDHGAIHQRFDSIAQEVQTLTGTTGPPYLAVIGPPEYHGGGYELSSHYGPDLDIIFINLAAYFAPSSILSPSGRESFFFHHFAHEYVHHLQYFKKAEGKSFPEVCLFEGVAYAIGHFMLPVFGGLVEFDSGTGEDIFSKGCLERETAGEIGECVMWHFQRYFGLRPRFFKRMFDPRVTTVDFESCTLNNPETGMGYLRFLSWVADENATNVVRDAGIALPIPYEEAKRLSVDELLER